MVVDTFSGLIDLFNSQAMDFYEAGAGLNRSYPDNVSIAEFSDALSQYSASATAINGATEGSDVYKEEVVTLLSTAALLAGLQQGTTWTMREYTKEIETWLANPPQLQTPNKTAYNAYLKQGALLRSSMVNLSDQINAAVVGLA